MCACRRALGDKYPGSGNWWDLNKLLVWSGSPASGGGMGWVPTLETKGSRDLGFSSRAQPPAGQLLWSSPARPRDCRGEEQAGAQRTPVWPVQAGRRGP